MTDRIAEIRARVAQLRKIYNQAASLASAIKHELYEHTARGELAIRDPFKQQELERHKGVLTNALPDIFGIIEVLEEALDAAAAQQAAAEQERDAAVAQITEVQRIIGEKDYPFHEWWKTVFRIMTALDMAPAEQAASSAPPESER